MNQNLDIGTLFKAANTATPLVRGNLDLRCIRQTPRPPSGGPVLFRLNAQLALRPLQSPLGNAIAFGGVLNLRLKHWPARENVG